MDIRSLLIKVGFKLEESTVDNVEKKIASVKSGLNDVEADANKAGSKASKNIAKIGDSASTAGNKLDSLAGKFNGLLAFAGASLTLGSIIGTIDEWKVVEGQVNNVTKSQQESKAVQEEIYNIASRTRQQYQSTAELYTSVARNAEELKKSTKDILLFTEDVSNAMLLGGGSASSQQAALVQLGQALGSGTLRGDELNSIMEQAPRLAKTIAEGMGTSIGHLREMGKEGKLTAVDVFNAVRSQSERLKMELGKMPWTVGQASTKMGNAIGKFFKKFEDSTGVVNTLAKGIAKVADYIENIDMDNFVGGMKAVAVYAAAFFVVSKWSAISHGMEMLIGNIKAIRNAYLAANGAQVLFQSASAKSAVLSMIAMGKFLLIAAAIAFVVLAVQDFYTWINGGDSIIGRHLGTWKDFVQGLQDKWNTVTNAISEFLNMRVIDMIKAAIGWVKDLINLLPGAMSAAGDWLKEKFGDNPLLEGFVNKARTENVELTPAQREAYGGLVAARGNARNNISNSGNQTNYITVNAGSNASPEDIGLGVANGIERTNGGLQNYIDNSNPAFAY